MAPEQMITPMEDFCGKEIFENETVRKYFISAVLRIPVVDIKKTRIMNPYLRFLQKKEKDGILDVLIELWDGRKINIEIQVAAINYWDRRSIFYLSRLYVQGFMKGSNYQLMKQCINISILDFNFLSTEGYHTVFRFRDEKGNDYSNALEIHIVELKKLKEEKNLFTDQDKREKRQDPYEEAVREWIQFFKCKKKEDVEMLRMKTKNPGIKEAIKELMTMNASDIIRAYREEKLKAIRDRNAREDYVRDEAEMKGIEKGQLIKTIDQVQRKMTKGKTAQQIAEELEEDEAVIQKIYEAVKTCGPGCNCETIYESWKRMK